VLKAVTMAEETEIAGSGHSPVRATLCHDCRRHQRRTKDIMEQQYMVDHGAADVKRLDSLPSGEPGCAATSTVISKGEWLAVSTEGFSEQQRGRPLAHLVKELVQNALDSVGSTGRIDLVVTPTGQRTASVRCADDGSGA